MSEPDALNLEQIQVDTANLYREEMVTDLKVASIQVLTPIKPDGNVDESRKTLYIAQTQLMSRAGLLPVNGPIEADSIDEALAKFPEAVKAAVDKMVEEAKEYQRQEANRIVVPSIERPPPGGIGGGQSGAGGSPGGFTLR